MDNVAEEMECPYCLEVYRNPVILRCSHNLCRECAENLIAFQALKVPSRGPFKRADAKVAQKDEGAVDESDLTLKCVICSELTKQSELKSNRTLSNIADEMRKEADSGSKCDICEERAASTECLKCELAYCAQCKANTHPKGKKRFLSHKFADVGTLKSKAQEHCRQHPGENLKLFCQDHQVLACLLCAQYGSHKGCECQTIDTVTQSDDGSHEEKVQALQAVHKELSNLRKQLLQATEKVATDKEGIIKEINKQTAARHREIDQEAATLLAQVKARGEQRQELLKSQTKGVDVAVKRAKTLLQDEKESKSNPFAHMMFLSNVTTLFEQLDGVSLQIPSAQKFIPLEKKKKKATHFVGTLAADQPQAPKGSAFEGKSFDILAGYLKESGLKNVRYKLLYKGSRDGLSCATFHQRCDNKGKTVTIVRNSNGYVFGGYAHHPWNRNGGWVTDNGYHNFLFRLSGGGGAAFRSQHYRNAGHSQYRHGSHGPNFGSGNDLHLNFDNPTSSSSNLGSAYAVPQGQNGKTALAGSYNGWTIQEVEVYLVP